MGREARYAAVHGVAKSRTRLSNWTELNWAAMTWKPFTGIVLSNNNNAKCREPAWGIPPVTRSCGRKPDKTQGRVRLQGFPLEIPEHPPPKTRICLISCVMLSTYSSVINRGRPPTTFFWKKLELLDNKSPGHNMSVSIQKPLWWLSSLPAGWACDCLRPPDCGRHRKLKTS